MLVKHKHYNLILQWAEGAQIERLDQETGEWELTHPMWFDCEEFRLYDPYRELREAAKDPNKEIRFNKNSEWMPASHWVFSYPPECYEIRDKPKKKVKMWQWLLQNDSKRFFTSNRFYLTAEDVARDHVTSKVIGLVPWTEIEVEMDMEGNIV
jgi:hypothetical protein